MIDGDCTYQKVSVVPANPIPNVLTANIPDNGLAGCCTDFMINVFADNTGIDLQNQRNTVINWFDKITTSAVMKLNKCENGAWVVKATITDNAYGIFSDFGTFVNDALEKFIYLEIKWSSVLLAFGEGIYKITTDVVVPVFGSKTIDSYEFNLKTYLPDLVNGTVLLEYWISGTTGDIFYDDKIKDFGDLIIYNSLRVNGVFGFPKSTYKDENIEYSNGKREYIEDSQEPVYELKLRMLPYFIHEILRTDFMMADEMCVTDFNSKNNGSFVKKYVRKDSGYEPEWKKLISNFANVELRFKQQYNRFRKLRN